MNSFREALAHVIGHTIALFRPGTIVRVTPGAILVLTPENMKRLNPRFS